MGGAGLKSAYSVPKTLYHFTSKEAAIIIGNKGISSSAGLFGSGVYGSSVNSAAAAKLMGARSVESSVAFSTKGLNVGRTLIPGAFRVKGSVSASNLLQ